MCETAVVTTTIREMFEEEVTQGVGADAFALERNFDASFVARLAIREKQLQQSYRPIISIHKWFARRPGSLFRSLMLAEMGTGELRDIYFDSNKLSGVIADPFMGGGTSIYEGLRLGLGVVGCDVNPMAYWLVRQAVEPIDLDEFRRAAELVATKVKSEIDNLYLTTCTQCQQPAPVKYFIWVKTCPCPACGDDVILSPGYLIAEAVRHPREVYYCPRCSALSEIDENDSPECSSCSFDLKQGNVKRGKAECLSCSHVFPFAGQLSEPPVHRLVCIEYQCATCYSSVEGRQFRAPEEYDLDAVKRSIQMLREREGELRIPNEEIPPGDETNRLLRWGYRRYRDMFNERQLVGLGILLNAIVEVQDDRNRQALATVFSDFLRYQNQLGRYDTYALKCQDIFSVHGFPVGLVVCEDSLIGIPRVGSGSFIHFVEKFIKAKTYSQHPYETRFEGRKKVIVLTDGEVIESPLVLVEPEPGRQEAQLSCGPSQQLALRERSLEGVFTDPPYFANVQYAELMDFCFVWLRTMLGDEIQQFSKSSTRTEHEITGNDTLGRGIEGFTEGLSSVFCRMGKALKLGRPLVFTYHHNDPLAYAPLVVAILDAGFTCTDVLPAPAEMSASLHIAGTKSSILDSVFVCRDQTWRREQLFRDDRSDQSVANRVEHDVLEMGNAGYMCTPGDIQCLSAGHAAADAVRALSENGWNTEAPLVDRLKFATDLLTQAAVTRQ